MDRKQDAACNEEKILQTIEAAKAAFYEGESETSLSRAEFLMQQSRYIKKRWWVLQGALLASLLWVLQAVESTYYIQRSLGVAAPMFVVLTLPELWKNRNCCATEVECTTYYSLRQIYAARLTLFAGVDLLLLSLFLWAVSFTTRLTLWQMLIQFVLPFNVACCICFHCLYSPKQGSEVFSLLLCAVFMALWMQVVLHDAVYQAISVPVWCALLSLSFVYLGCCILRGQRRWQLMYEVKPVWN